MRCVMVSMVLYGDHSHSRQLFELFIMHWYQRELGWLGFGGWGSEGVCNRRRIYWAARKPDSIAPSMKPWDYLAISVPAQWILPYGALISSILVRTPGGKKATGPPLITFSQFQTFQCTDKGLNICSALKYVAKVSTILFSAASRLRDHSRSTAPFKNTTIAGCSSPFSLTLLSSQALKTGDCRQSDRVSPLKPFSLQQGWLYRKSTLLQLPIRLRSQMQRRPRDSWGSNQSLLMRAGGIAIIRQSDQQRLPLVSSIVHWLSVWVTLRTKHWVITLPPRLSIYFLKNRLRYWAPLVIFLSWSPSSIVIRFLMPPFCRIQSRKNKKLTQSVSAPSTALTAHQINSLTLFMQILRSIQDRRVQESHLKLKGEALGLQGSSLLAILSSFHMLNCMWIRPGMPTSRGMFVRQVEIRVWRSRIFVPEWNWGMSSFWARSASFVAYF